MEKAKGEISVKTEAGMSLMGSKSRKSQSCWSMVRRKEGGIID